MHIIILNFPDYCFLLFEYEHYVYTNDIVLYNVFLEFLFKLVELIFLNVIESSYRKKHNVYIQKIKSNDCGCRV
jgi:hypothetical protein